MPHATGRNAARDVGQRRTRCWQFPPVAFPIAPHGNWRKSTRHLSFRPFLLVLSLHLPSKRLFANHRFQRKTRFKPLFYVWGRKVPPKEKQALKTRVAGKYFDKQAAGRADGSLTEFVKGPGFDSEHDIIACDYRLSLWQNTLCQSILRAAEA